MTVDLLSIINIEGKSLTANDEIDFSDKNEFDVRFCENAKVEAKFTVLGDCIKLFARVLCPVEYMCDRCGTFFSDKLELEFEETFKKEAPQNDDADPDVIILSGSRVLMDDIVYKNIFMSLPVKKLCREDCKGLCIKCGQNLNEKDCGCDTRESDPRFDALDNFFK